MSAYINRWPRAIARVLDLFWQLLVIAPMFVWLAVAAGLRIENSLVFFLFIFLVSLPFAFLLDALVAGLFGNTPAKSLLGLKVKTSKGESLRLHEYVRRNYEVWTQGFSIGILPFTLISGIRQFKHISGRRPATYDELLHFQVHSAVSSSMRASLALGILCISPLVFSVVMPLVGSSVDSIESANSEVVKPTENLAARTIQSAFPSADDSSADSSSAESAVTFRQPVEVAEVAVSESVIPIATGQTNAEPVVETESFIAEPALAESLVVDTSVVDTSVVQTIPVSGNSSISDSIDGNLIRWVNPVSGFETTINGEFSVQSTLTNDQQLGVFNCRSGAGVVTFEQHQSPRGLDAAKIPEFLETVYPQSGFNGNWNSYQLSANRVFESQGIASGSRARISIQATSVEGTIYVLLAEGAWPDSGVVKYEQLKAAVWNTF